MWSMEDLTTAQKLIDNFINKKESPLIFINISSGGTSTPNLHLRNLAAKRHFWKKLCDIKDEPLYFRPSWPLPIFRLISAYNFTKPLFIIMSGNNNIRNLHNIFRHNGYSYWAHSLDALINMRKIQDFSYDKLRRQKNKTAPITTPSWVVI